MLNRCAVVVRPKQPYLDWAKQYQGSGAPFTDDERIVYLLPEYADEKEARQTLERAFDMIFEAELNGWHTNEDDWPQNRTFALFKKWFYIEVNAMVQDLCGDPLEDDEFDE